LEAENNILSKEDFVQYLKYLKTLLKEEFGEDIKIIKDINECIEMVLNYTPSVYYYHELSESYNEVIEKKVKKSIIRWSKVSTWKAYLRKSRIKKLNL
jgi:transcriptional regulatory protein LevR